MITVTASSEALPPEVLNILFQNLEPKDKIAAMQVCQMFHEIIKEMIFLTHVIQPSQSGLLFHTESEELRLDRDRFMVVLLSSKVPPDVSSIKPRPNSTGLDLTSTLDSSTHFKISLTELGKISTLFGKRLKRLSLQLNNIPAILQTCPYLQSLKLYYASFEEHSSPEESPNLTQLDLSACSV